MIDYNPAKAISERDNISLEDSEELIDEIRDEMMSMIEQGDFEGAEEYFSSSTGLEPDYIMDLF